MPKLLPPIVSAEEWQRERDALLAAEKDAMHVVDAVAARRRRMPMVAFPKLYAFDTPHGKKSLLELFDGREQLLQYQFMDRGPDEYCEGCTGVTNNVPVHALEVLAKRGFSWVTISNMPLEQIDRLKARMGWTLPFVSSRGTTFTTDTGAGDHFMLSVFVRDGDAIYRTYATSGRGVDRLLFSQNMLDLGVWGREEDWEDSPPGYPKHPIHMLS